MSAATGTAIGQAKHVTLYYNTGNIPATDPRYKDSTWKIEDFVSVLRFPLAEMLTATPESVAVELVDITTDPTWAKRGTRALRVGDVMAYGKDAWLYVYTENATDFEALGMPVLQMVDASKRRDYSKWSIVCLTRKG